MVLFTNNKTTRVCCDCKIEKPLTLENFDTRQWRNKKAIKGDREFTRLCKPCRLIRNKNRYHLIYKNDPIYIENMKRNSYNHYIKEGKEKATKRKMRERYARKIKDPETFFSKQRAKNNAWFRAHPGYRKKYNAIAKHSRRTLDPLLPEVYVKVIEEINNLCVFCGKQANTIEHILCIKRGGTNEYENLTTSCKSCNSSKNNRYLLNFIWEKVKMGVM